MRTRLVNKIWAKVAGLSLLFIIPLQGCVEDDLSVCGVSVDFVFTKNVEGIDKFPTNVDKINLFIYDFQGNFIGEFSEEGARLHSGPMKLNLMEGRYSLVAWGNLFDDYKLHGIEGFTDANLSLIRANDTIKNRPGDLYHGMLYQVEIKPDLQNNQLLTIELTKNTNNVVVTTIGMPYNEHSKTSYDCSIVSKNGDYKFDNSITGPDRLHYMPESFINEEEERVSDFIIMRELNDKAITGSQLLIIRKTEGEAPVTLVRTSLTDLLIPISITGDLDIDDYFEIEVEITETNGTASIFINGWDALGGGGPV